MEETFIGPYRLDQQLGSGGLSTVYSATDTRTGRRVAIKTAKLPKDPSAHASFRELFLQETSVLATLKHPSVASILERGTAADGSPYFVMELLEGTSLDAILDREKSLPAEVALSIARQVAAALGAAHAIGYLHRDVKPGNIMVLDAGSAGPWTIKLMDFGVAARVDEETQLTVGGGLYGSVAYMSPEQLTGKPLSYGSDLWQLGVTFFQMLTGSLPFDDGGTMKTMTAILKADVTWPVGIDLPAPLVGFIQRCLEKDVALRPANGAEALRELEQIRLDAAATRSMPVPVASAAPAPVDRTPTVATPAASPQTAARRFPFLAIGVGVVAAAALALSLVLARNHLPPGAGVPQPGGAHSADQVRGWGGIAFGAVLALGGVFVGKGLMAFLASRRHEISGRAQEILNGARNHDELSKTLAIQVDEISARCRQVDERFLVMTMAVMVDEFGASATFDDRQKALMNAVTLLEKLMAKLSPWYVRHDKLIALTVTLIGVLSGCVTIAQNVAKLVKGT